MSFEFLERAIARQFQAFPTEPRGAVQGCACCTTSAQLDALVRVPRESLSAKELDVYAFKAMTTVGNADDFRYFWPRLAELAISDALSTDREVLFGKPLYGRHSSWPQSEQDALRLLAAALSERFAVETPDEFDIDSWLCAIARLIETIGDLAPFLAPLTRSTEAARENLLVLVDRNWQSIDERERPSNAFWDDAPHGAASFVAWFRHRPEVRAARVLLDQNDAEQYASAPRRTSSPSSS
jgi:hypothetical protein